MYFIETLPDAPDPAWTRYDMEGTLDAALALALVVARTRSLPDTHVRVVGSPRYDGTPGVWSVAYPGPHGTETEPVRVWAVGGARIPPTDRPPE